LLVLLLLSLPQYHNLLPPHIFSDTLNVLAIGPTFISTNFDDHKATIYYNLKFFPVIREYFSEQGEWAKAWRRV
jgi:hypothetical protein